LLLIGAVLGTTAWSLLSEPSATFAWRLAVVALAVAILGWYAGVGHPTLRQSLAAREYVCCGGLLVLFVGALALTPTAAYLLVGLPAIGHVLLPNRQGYVLAAAFCVAPTVVFLVRTHDPSAALRVVVPIGVASMLFSFVIATAVNRIIQRSDERARLIAELEESRAEVARLSRAAGIAEERQRLAGEIHDTVAQGLSSVVMLVQAAEAALGTDADTARQHLAMAERTARENLAETRAIVAALTPAPLAGASLPEALRRTAERFGAQTGVRAAVDLCGEPRALPTAVEVVLLRAAQEGLTNAHRHGRAERVDLALTFGADCVCLEIRDDGCGFDPGEVSHGYGLAAMRGRTEQVGGALTIRRGVSAGTVLRLAVPG
jgi:signal transduction histidine kinase